jgi:hypothetical protein
MIQEQRMIASEIAERIEKECIGIKPTQDKPVHTKEDTLRDLQRIRRLRINQKSKNQQSGHIDRSV